MKIKPREPLVAFGESMERKLRRRDGRYSRPRNAQPWLDFEYQHFFNRAMEELLELRDALRRGNLEDIADEACDVGNLMMMVHDLARSGSRRFG